MRPECGKSATHLDRPPRRMQPRLHARPDLTRKPSIAMVVLALIVPCSLVDVVVDDVESRVRERRVRQPEAEAEARLNPLLQERTVTDHQFFTVLDLGIGIGGTLGRRSGGDDLGGVVVLALGDRVGESTGRVVRAVEDVDESVAGFLTLETGPDDGGDVGVVDPGLEEERSDRVLARGSGASAPPSGKGPDQGDSPLRRPCSG